MLKSSKKQKIILFSFLIIFLAGFLLTGPVRISGKKITALIGSKLSVLAQELEPYATFFFPRYPDRLKYIAYEIFEASEDLIFLNEELNKEVEKCSCGQAISQCVAGGGPASLGSLSFLYSSGKKQLGANPSPLCKTFLSLSDDVGEETLENLEQDLNNLKNEIPNLEREIEKLESSLKTALQRNLGELKQIISKVEGNLREGKLEQLKSNLAELKRIGELLENQLSGIRQIPEEIKNRFLSPFTGIKAGFARFLGQILACLPGQGRTFGDPCPNREILEEKQSEIREKSEQILFLRNLLIAEMETGLERELKSLREEEATELRAALEQVLTESQGLSSAGLQNSALPSDCTARNCTPVCQLGTIFKLEACARISLGQQKPLVLNFKVGLGLQDLDLGGIGIKDINLGLPDEVNLTRMGNLVLTIPSQEFTVSFPPEETLPDLSSQTFTLSSPQLSMPKVPEITVPCPNFPARSSYQCSIENQSAELENSQLNQYFEEFSRLSEQCQDLLGPDPECMEAETAGLRKEYNDILENCKANDCEKCEDEECKKNCCDVAEMTGKINEQIDIMEAQTAQVCKRPECFDPQSLGLNNPEDFSYENPAVSCPSKTIGDYPSSRLSCPASLPTIPKLRLPSIIIPDIIMGEFKLFPFVYIKLPRFVFEDLILPEIVLCDLDECKNFFPSLKFQLPSLNLPLMRIPDAQAPEGGAPKINMETFVIPPIPFNLPGMEELNLSSLISPDLAIPNFPLPRPRLIVSLEGIDANIGWALLSFLLHRFGVPDFNVIACVWLKGSFPLPLRIIFPDFYFSWPDLPHIPQIPYCKDVNKFCRQVKTKLKKVTDKVTYIQDTVNKVFQKEIQEKLDNNTTKIQAKIAGEIRKYLEKVSLQIKVRVEENYELAEVRNGKIYVPPAFIRTEKLEIPILLAEDVGIPEKIPISWPAALKKVSLDEPIVYDIPPIPLSKLSYTKNIPIKVPGFQLPSLSVALEFNAECSGGPALGGNPCPVSQININLGQIKGIQGRINSASQKIIDILE